VIVGVYFGIGVIVTVADAVGVCVDLAKNPDEQETKLVMEIRSRKAVTASFID
jgi:hypothetical protein